MAFLGLQAAWQASFQVLRLCRPGVMAPPIARVALLVAAGTRQAGP